MIYVSTTYALVFLLLFLALIIAYYFYKKTLRSLEKGDIYEA